MPQIKMSQSANTSIFFLSLVLWQRKISLWIIVWAVSVALPHHLHFFPPSSTTALLGAAVIVSGIIIPAAVLSFMADSVSRTASSSTRSSSTSSPYVCWIWQFLTYLFLRRKDRDKDCKLLIVYDMTISKVGLKLP